MLCYAQEYGTGTCCDIRMLDVPSFRVVVVMVAVDNGMVCETSQGLALHATKVEVGSFG